MKQDRNIRCSFQRAKTGAPDDDVARSWMSSFGINSWYSAEDVRHDDMPSLACQVSLSPFLDRFGVDRRKLRAWSKFSAGQPAICTPASRE
jgi:hypothetical protein